MHRKPFSWMILASIKKENPPFMKKYFKVTVCFVLLLACSRKEKAGSPATGDTTTDTTGLHAHAGFPVGAAINIDLLKNNTVYAALVAKEFNSVTAENV